MIDNDEVKEGFVIDTDAKAEWALKNIREAQKEHDRLKELAMDEINELERKIEELDKRLESDTGYMKTLLHGYFQKVDKKETKTQQSYKLLTGTLVFKKPSLKMVPDKEKLLAYCKANNMPEFIKVKEEVDWAGYKKECEIVDGRAVNVQTGDLLPEDMIQIEEVPASFDVKF